MRVVRKPGRGRRKVHATLPSRIARASFTMHLDGIALLHGFIKKGQEAPTRDLALARERLRFLPQGPWRTAT